ncbi:pentatricopeptide repeat-containing protein At5g15300 isoform X3 [Hevea brasiliensis]|uniref:pentatricopeptide repeat-containing protein At5g15300 isoform X3 n=1 Tax=Hevea brasiliensis TaxID=3981 RepID=UPI000B777F78|nr:pentatricopeptide repeat-containing protein At5g15300 isoform X3 [Hevea brasiliensis]
MIRKRTNDRSTNRQQWSSLWQNCTNLPSLKQIHASLITKGFNSCSSALRELIFASAIAVSGTMDYAHQLFAQIAEPDIFMWNTMMRGYARRGQLSVARQLFDEMPVKDLVAWNVMITAYVKKGEMKCARRLFDEVPKRDVVTWNVMIAGYVLCGENRQALEMFEEMRGVGEQPDEVTMLSLLSACTDLGDLDVGMKVHRSILEMSLGDLSVLLGNALIYMYAKCGSIERALEVFRGMREKDVSTWNSVIVGLAFHGHAEESINLFAEMRRLKNISPNEITFVGVLVACSHAGKVEGGRQYFNLMKDVYGIEPNVRHYGCMVDLLGRAGLLNDAFEFIENMNIEPNAVIWRTLLGACRIHGNVELGRLANEKLLEMRRDESGDYVLLSNIYASVGEWDGVQKVRNLMDDSGVRKEPGCSIIEADEEKALMQFLFDSKRKLNSRNQIS